MSNVLDVEMNIKEDPLIVRTWRHNQNTTTIMMSVPHKLAKKYGITYHTNLLAIDTDEGILFKKLEAQK
jgi:hypothetical protein